MTIDLWLSLLHDYNLLFLISNCNVSEVSTINSCQGRYLMVWQKSHILASLIFWFNGAVTPIWKEGEAYVLTNWSDRYIGQVWAPVFGFLCPFAGWFSFPKNAKSSLNPSWKHKLIQLICFQLHDKICCFQCGCDKTSFYKYLGQTFSLTWKNINNTIYL